MRSDSDIDVLIITKTAKNLWAKAKLYAKIAREIGVDHPFEIHIVTPKEYEN